MVKKRVDPRVKGLIDYNVKKGHRSLFVLVGDHGKDQVENLHKVLSKARVKTRPSVLWCYKKELGFSTHRKKRIKEIKRNQARGLHDPDRDDPFDLFISSTNIRWTYYKETEKILGQTFGMCVLQDFEALTPNLLARTIETVEGGGIIVILLKTVKSLKQLYTLSMDVHSRFRTEAHHEIVPRFNERFILSLSDCNSCLVLDDELNILPISSKMEHIPINDLSSTNFDNNDEGYTDGYVEDPQLTELKETLIDTPNIGSLVTLARTVDQANVVMSFLDTVSEKNYKSTIALTAARGRGKSAAIGMCLAGAISYGFTNIFVTAPSPENLKTVFEFVISGLKALKYSEHLDFEVLYEHQGDQGKVVTRINVIKSHRQSIQYILPSDTTKLSQAELLAIDEAAAIPLPIVKALMGPYIVFLSSTINGYEGTGRALSLKLIQQLRIQQGQAMLDAAKQASQNVIGAKNKKGERQVHEERWKVAAEAAAAVSVQHKNNTRILKELTLDTPIRYKNGDMIEKWLNQLLCLDMTSYNTRIVNIMPAPHDCDLYIVNRDALFSYHALSELLLQRIWSLYTSAHYKNTPNDLQMLSDAPAHRLFVLLGPQHTNTTTTTSTNSNNNNNNNKPVLPDILCVIQVAYEGYISKQSIQTELMKANKASGDLIPWTLAQQFNDHEFATLSGARIVRIATHPDVQKMGYGSRAIDLLIQYYQGQLTGGCNPPSVLSGQFGGEGGASDSPAVQALHSVNSILDKNTKSSTNNTMEVPGNGDLLNETIIPRKKLPSLLTPISERPCERLHWLGVSFGLTTQLLNFWTRKGFKTCYLRQTINDLTGEHSSIVLRELSCDDMEDAPTGGWVDSYVTDYRRRLVSLMSYAFNKLEIPLAITLIDPERRLTSSTIDDSADDTYTNTASTPTNTTITTTTANTTTTHKEDHTTNAMITNKSVLDSSMNRLTASELLSVHMSHHDMKRLELYSRNMVDHHMILDCLPILSRLVFLSRITGLRFSYLQVGILLATGLQHRDVDSIAKELDIPVSQVLAFFNKTVRKISSYLRELIEKDISTTMLSSQKVNEVKKRIHAEMNTTNTPGNIGNLKDEHESDTKKFKQNQKNQAKATDSDDASPTNAQSDLNNIDKDNDNKKATKKSTTTTTATKIEQKKEFQAHIVKADSVTLDTVVQSSIQKLKTLPTTISVPIPKTPTTSTTTTSNSTVKTPQKLNINDNDDEGEEYDDMNDESDTNVDKKIHKKKGDKKEPYTEKKKHKHHNHHKDNKRASV